MTLLGDSELGVRRNRGRTELWSGSAMVCVSGGISEESLTFPPGPCVRAVGEEELEWAPGKTAHSRGTPCPLGRRWGNAQSGG